MLRIGGQRIPAKTLLLLAGESLQIILGLALATALRFIFSGWDQDWSHAIAFVNTAGNGSEVCFL